MRYFKTAFVVFIVTVSFIITTTVAMFHTQENAKSNQEAKGKDRLSELPLVDYESQEPPDPDKRAKRLAKSKKYNVKTGQGINPTNPVRRGALHNDWEFGLDSVLPVKQSTAIVVGEVVGANAYLSEDKTNVYSEFTVKVEAILKNDPQETLIAGELINTERQGGRVRLPSGHIENFYIAGQAPPLVGKRYVLFLGYNKHDTFNRSVTDPSELSRHILTAYELRAGKVVPLDSAGGKNFQEHAGKDEIGFLNEIRRLIDSL